MIEKFIEEAMRKEAMTGKIAKIKMKSEYFNKVFESEVRFVEAEGYIAGVSFHIDDYISEDYIVYV